MAKIKVALDDGHGTETPGKRTPLFNDGSFMKEMDLKSQEHGEQMNIWE